MFLRMMPANQTIGDQFSWTFGRLFVAIGLEWRRLGTSHAMQTAMQARLLGLWRRLKLVLEQ
jgi:hypothetical protein